MKSRLPVLLQTEANECGLASLAMIAASHGLCESIADLRQKLPVSRKGVTVRGLVMMAESLGLISHPLKLELEDFRHLRLPCVLHWDMDHFVVLRSVGRNSVVIHDPAVGARKISLREFSRRFTGVAVEFELSASPRPAADEQTTPRRRPIELTRKHRRSFAQIVALTALLEILAILMPLMLQWTVDAALPSRTVLAIDGLAIAFGLLVLVSGSIDVARGWLVALVGAELNFSWSRRVLAHLLRLPLDYFERRHLGDIMTSFNSIMVLQRAFTTGFMEAIVDGAMALGTLAMMVHYNLTGALTAMAAIGIYALLCTLLRAPLRQATAEQIVQMTKQQSHFLETLRGIQSVRLFAIAGQRQSGWTRLAGLQTNAELRVRGLTLTHATASRIVFNLLRVGLICLGAHSILDGNATIGTLFAFLAYLDQFVLRTTALIDRALEFAVLRLHIERVDDIVQTTPEPADPQSPGTIITERSLHPPSIRVEGLTYAYGFSEQPVLQNVSLEVRPGECVAVIGPSGCGKTTLVKLMLGLLEPTCGEITINGVPLAQMGRERLRAMSATVMQEDQLFTGSLSDNISFFDSQPDQDRVRRCARQAAIHDEIEAMPMGYYTLVGEAGVGLSGGQKQRIMLARALYRQPKLLVLDEATSHLDIDAERSVNAAIRELDLTRIIIAHRPETIAMADRVIILGTGGRIGKIEPATGHRGQF